MRCLSSERLSDPVQLRSRPYDQTAARNGRGRHTHFLERILPNHLELGPSLDHKRVSIFTERENLAVIRPRRCRKCGRFGVNSLLAINFTAGARIVTGHYAAI